MLVIMDFDSDFSFLLPPSVRAVQVLDFDPMMEDCDDVISYIELQNAKPEKTYDHQIWQDILTLPSYGSFVDNLNRREEDDYFENTKSSTIIDNLTTNEMDVNHWNDTCPVDCNCEACLKIYFDSPPSDSGNDSYSEYNNDLYYDFTALWDQEQFTTYTDLPQFVYTSTCTTSENVKLLLRSKILARSSSEVGTTSGYDSSSTNL